MYRAEKFFTVKHILTFILSFLFVFVSFADSNASSLDDWEWRNPLPQGNQIQSVASDGSIIVAVGNGVVMTSSDGVAWVKRTDVTPDYLNDIIYDGATFVAVGNNGRVISSTDGNIWTLRTAGTTQSFNSVAYGNGIYVAVGTSGMVMTSTDSVTWTSRTSGTTKYLNGVSYANSTFVAVGASGTVLTSPDGVTWTSRTSGTAQQLFEVIYSNSTFVATGWGGTVLTSPDGVTWTSRTSGTTQPLYDIDYLGSTFVAVGGRGIILTSPDAVTWTISQAANTVTTNEALKSVAYVNSTYVVVGGPMIFTSSDTITWTLVSIGTPLDLNAIEKLNSNYLAVGFRGAITMSPDGITWDVKSSGSIQELLAVTYGNGLYVVVGNNRIQTSPDGDVWTLRYSGDTFYGVAYGNSIFVAVGDGGIIVTSPDGVTWTERTSGTANTLLSVIYANSLFVAVGSTGTILTSPDGITWTVRDPGSTFTIYDVTYGNSLFVAVGTWGEIATSSDAVSWTARTTGVLAHLESIAYGNSTFVATVQNDLVTSSDGIDWSLSITEAETGSTNYLSDIVFTGSGFIMVGDNGTILQSINGPLITSVVNEPPFGEADSWEAYDSSGNNQTETIVPMSPVMPLTITDMIESTAVGTDAQLVPIASSSLFYTVTTKVAGVHDTTPPEDTGGNYIEVDMVKSIDGTPCAGATVLNCTADIPATPDGRVWYYVKVFDETGRDDRRPNARYDSNGDLLYNTYVYDFYVFDACDFRLESPTGLVLTENMIAPGSDTIDITWNEVTTYDEVSAGAPNVAVIAEDTVQYYVYRRDNMGSSAEPFTRIMTGSCAGPITGATATLTCTDGTVTGLDIIANDYSYYVVAVNSCAVQESIMPERKAECVGSEDPRLVIMKNGVDVEPGFGINAGDSFEAEIRTCTDMYDGFSGGLQTIPRFRSSGEPWTALPLEMMPEGGYLGDEGYHAVTIYTSIADLGLYNSVQVASNGDTVTFDYLLAINSGTSPQDVSIFENACDNVPGPPESLQLTNAGMYLNDLDGIGNVNLSWLAPFYNTDGTSPVNDLSGYDIEESIDGGPFTVIASVGTATTASFFKGFEPVGTELMYRISAIDACPNWSNYSEWLGPVKVGTCNEAPLASPPDYASQNEGVVTVNMGPASPLFDLKHFEIYREVSVDGIAWNPPVLDGVLNDIWSSYVADVSSLIDGDYVRYSRVSVDYCELSSALSVPTDPIIYDSGALGLVPNDLIVEFGSGIGLWAYFNNSSWSKLSSSLSEDFTIGDLNGTGIEEVIVDFGTTGVWGLYDNASWSKLSSSNAEGLVIGNINGNATEDLVVDFGGVGLWAYYDDNYWSKISSSNAEGMVMADLDGSGADDLTVDFGAVGLWTYYNDTSWTKTSSSNAEDMVAADLNGNGNLDLVVDFGALGVWTMYDNGSWTKTSSSNPESMAVGNLNGAGTDEVAFDFGSTGVWVFYDNASWSKVSTSDAEGLTMGDLNSNGTYELIVDFGAVGLWTMYDNGSWTKTSGSNPVGPQGMATGDIDGN